MAIFNLVTGILSILFILLIAFLLKGKKILPRKVQKTLFPIYGGTILLIALICAFFFAPNIPAGKEVAPIEKQKRLYEHWDMRELPADYKTEEWTIDNPKKSYSLELEDWDIDMISYPTFSVEYEAGRKDIKIMRYETSAQILGVDIEDSSPPLDLEIEGETLLLKNEQIVPILENFYQIRPNDVMNQFVQDEREELQGMDYDEPEVHFHIIAPEGVEFKSLGEIFYIEEVEED